MVSWTEAFSSFVPADVGWQNYDIFTNLSVPKGAVAEILMVHATTDASRTLGVRADGSALNRYVVVHEAEAPANSYTGCVMRVKVDAATGLIETYCDATANVIFYLLDYFTGVDFTERFDQFEPAAQAAWTDKDLSGYGVPANAVCQMLLENPGTAYYCDMGVRANGSALARLIRVHESEPAGSCHYTNYVKADATSIIESYHQYLASPDRFTYLLGYFGSELDYAELWSTKNIVNNTTWEDFDLTAELDQDGRVVNVLMFNTGVDAANVLGARKNGSAVNRYYTEHEAETYGVTGECFTVQTDASGIIELYASVAAAENSYLAGYFKFSSDVVPTNPKGSNLVSTMMQTLNSKMLFG
jgi:hypothetical protein